MDNYRLQKIDYNFAGKNPNDILTEDEFLNFDEGMKPKNTSLRADEVDFDKAVQSIIQNNELDQLYPEN